MLEKLRTLYEKKLVIKVLTVLLVVFFSIAIMIPLLSLAELFGVNVRENANINLKVDFANIFFFFLFGACSVTIIWLAQKYLHSKELVELGFRSKIFKPFIFGFILGAFQIGLEYFIFILFADKVEYTSVIPSNVSLLSYIGYYIYFLFGMIIWNSFIEELGTRAYPIETLKNHLNPHVIFTLMGILFTLGHFVIHDFSVGSFVGIFIASYTYSLLYYFSGSIWLVIGTHSGLNWVGFSFFGTNWKLGALLNTSIYDIPNWIYNFTGPFIGILVLLLIIYAHKKDLLKKLYA